MKKFALSLVVLLGLAVMFGGCEPDKSEENSGRGEPEEVADSTRLDPAVDTVTPVGSEKQGQ